MLVSLEEWLVSRNSFHFLVPTTEITTGQVNLSYIFWVAAYNTSFVLGYLLLDIYFSPSKLKQSPDTKLAVPVGNPELRGDPPSQHPPALLDAINKNGFPLFLLVSIYLTISGSLPPYFTMSCRLTLLPA